MHASFLCKLDIFSVSDVFLYGYMWRAFCGGARRQLSQANKKRKQGPIEKSLSSEFNPAIMHDPNLHAEKPPGFRPISQRNSVRVQSRLSNNSLLGPSNAKFLTKDQSPLQRLSLLFTMEK